MVHPADDPDLLIRELVTTRRAVTPEEIARIIERMASAPFDPRLKSVPLKEQGLTYQGRVLGRREPSLFYHLVKRVVIEKQWTEGTSKAQYFDDLRRAMLSPLSRLMVYERRGGRVAATMTTLDAVLPRYRRGPGSLAFVLTLYSADRGIPITGYQITSIETTSIPENPLWLR